MRLQLLAPIFVISAALLPVTASGQTAAPRPGQAAPAPRPAQAAPAPVKAPAPATSAPSQGGGASKTSATKLRVPANLFKLGDAEIIFVGGKNVTAGEVRHNLRAEILRDAGQPKLAKLASRKVPGQTHLPISADVAAMLARSQADRKAPTIVDCTQQAPTILAIEGSVASGQQFTILGRCFGEKNGDVKLIGQFPGGNLHVTNDPVHPGVTFTHWDAGRIVAALPAVSGSPDHTIAVSVITDGTKRESPAKQATFVAARTRVEVPARAWSPRTHFEFIRNMADGPDPTAPNPTKFDVSVNAACALDDIEVHAASGTVTAINGWTDGPPNSSTVQIGWQPQVNETSYWYSAISDLFWSSIFDVKAWANCPVGIAP